MKVLLNGYLHESNFGDILSAHMFYKKCLSKNFSSVDFLDWKFYRIGSFCRKELDYFNHSKFLDSDIMILISGGCLSETYPNFINYLIKYIRFVLPCLIYELLGKKVYILGVGGGKMIPKWYIRKVIKMLNKATYISVRNKETRDYLIKYDIKNTVEVTADTILTLNKEELPILDIKKELDSFCENKKKIFLHISENNKINKDINEKIIPGLIKFLNKHKEFIIVCSYDNLRLHEQGIMLNDTLPVKSLINNQVFLYNYNNCMQMCSLLNEMDIIITHKLHVGVVGATLEKSVLSFAVHPKTKRFYKNIGEDERCINMKDVSSNLVYKQLEKYYDKPIKIDNNIKERAKINLDIINNIK